VDHYTRRCTAPDPADAGVDAVVLSRPPASGLADLPAEKITTRESPEFVALRGEVPGYCARGQLFGRSRRLCRRAQMYQRLSVLRACIRAA
jgi:hypothetical protein